MERTLAIIKPNAIKNAGNIIAMIQEDLDCDITNMKMMELTREQAESLYEEHKELSKFEGLVWYMSNKPIIAIVLDGPDIIKKYRILMKEIRAKYSEYAYDRPDWYSPPIFAYDDLSHMKNAVHGSDSPESASREIKLIFGINWSKNTVD